MKHRILSLLLALVLVFGLCGAVTAEAASTYVINGNSVRYNSVPWPGKNECWKYANSIYKLIWGKNFDSTFTGSASPGHNMLRNLPDEKLIFTEENLKTYISQAQLGAVIRICDAKYLHALDGWGHSLILVQKDAKGFTTFDSISSGTRERYWTWNEFYRTWSSRYANYGSRYAYIKYIKWPNAPAFNPGGTSAPSAPTVDRICSNPGCAGTVFADMPAESHWAHKGVDFVYKAGLYSGTSKTTFAPQMTMDRAMLVTVLWRYQGKPTSSGINPFMDVPAGAYYTDAVLWANEAGLIEGIGDGLFDPTGSITREQLGTLFYRFAAFEGADTSARTSIDGFPDRGSVSDYAVTGLQWAVATNLIQGSVVNGVNHLHPLNNTTREQVATILLRFVQWLNS